MERVNREVKCNIRAMNVNNASEHWTTRGRRSHAHSVCLEVLEVKMSKV